MQVDFYILGNDSPRTINQMVCRLCEKATGQNMNVLIYTQSIQQAQELDNLLWTYKADSFIAHTNYHQNQNNFSQSTPRQTEPAFDFPVLIISADSLPPVAILDQYNQLLINLTTESPPFHAKFKRLAELVGKNDDEKQIARDRYRFYRQKDYSLNKFDL